MVRVAYGLSETQAAGLLQSDLLVGLSVEILRQVDADEALEFVLSRAVTAILTSTKNMESVPRVLSTHGNLANIRARPQLIHEPVPISRARDAGGLGPRAFRGAFPPVLLRAVCLVLAMSIKGVRRGYTGTEPHLRTSLSGLRTAQVNSKARTKEQDGRARWGSDGVEVV